MPQLGIPELLIILVIIIAVFGAGKIANLGGALGKGVRDFRKNIKSEEEDAKPQVVSVAETERSDNERA